MKQSHRLPLIALAVAAASIGMVAAYRWSTHAPAPPDCRPGALAYSRLELLFGLGRPGGGEVSEEEWRAFVESEVTPRFPDGLTVLSGYGQWRGPSGTIAKEPSRVLLIWYRRNDRTDAEIDAIRQAYKTKFAQESVLRVDGLSCASF
ncbi:MAG: DUF3574 domain-containing protein [Hyphomicrobiaceae bacterium]